MAISDTATDSFSNIEENDLHSSGDSGSWQKVTKDANAPQQSSSQPATNPPLPTIDFATQTGHSTPVGTLSAAEAMMDRREISMNGNPQTLTPNATYALENVQAQPQQLSSRTATTPLFQGLHVGTHNNHSARARMGMGGNPQNIFQNAAYVRTSQTGYNYNASGYTPTSQAAYPNASTGSLGHMWSPDVYGMQVPGDFDMTSFQPAISSLQNTRNHQWGD
jgi:hypothetical protein